MAEARSEAGVRLVTGDTKVVNRGHGDGVFINTSGVGTLADGVSWVARNAGRATWCWLAARWATMASPS